MSFGTMPGRHFGQAGVCQTWLRDAGALFQICGRSQTERLRKYGFCRPSGRGGSASGCAFRARGSTLLDVALDVPFPPAARARRSMELLRPPRRHRPHQLPTPSHPSPHTSSAEHLRTLERTRIPQIAGPTASIVTHRPPTDDWLEPGRRWRLESSRFDNSHRHGSSSPCRWVPAKPASVCGPSQIRWCACRRRLLSRPSAPGTRNSRRRRTKK